MISVCDMTVYSSQHFFFNVFVFYSLTTVIPDSILKLAPDCAGPPQWEWESEHTLFLVTRVEGKSAFNKYVRKKTDASKMAAIPSHPPFSWAGRRTAEWEGNRPGFDWYFKYVKYFSCAWYFQAQWESPKSAKLPHLALQTGWNKCSNYFNSFKYYLNPGLKGRRWWRLESRQNKSSSLILSQAGLLFYRRSVWTWRGECEED